MSTMVLERSTARRAAANGGPRRGQARARAFQQSRSRGRARAARQVRAAVPRQRAHRGSYQGVILAEFVGAIILVAATPIATRKAPAGSTGTSTGLSPYAASDVLQLGALTLAYLVLALISMGGSEAGRVAAWFGGLLLLGVGLGEAAVIAKTLNVFGTSVSSPGGTVSASASASLGPALNSTIGPSTSVPPAGG